MTLQGLVNQAYPSPEWVTFFEVSNGTGSNARRRADAVALGVWPSRGHTIVGFEFKTDRRDWLREKQNPAKAETVSAHCDCWWLVISEESVAKVDELPAPWGLYVANADRTRLLVKKQCQFFPEREKSTMRRSFASAMLRKVGETTVPRAELQRLIEVGVQAALAGTRDGRELEHWRTRAEQLEGDLAQFKAITGVDVRDWRGTEKIAKAVNAVLNLDGTRHQLERAAVDLERAAREVKAAVAAWPSPAEVSS